MSEDVLYWLALTAVQGVGNVYGRALAKYAGSAKKVFELPLAKLMRVEGIGEKVARAVLAPLDMSLHEREIRFTEKENIQIITIQDDNYPQTLAECPDAPLVLFYKGNAPLNSLRSLAVVGTRHATPYGRSVTEEIIRNLSGYPVMIVSGMAYGIDHIAHTAAIEAGIPTIAVLAHGLDRIYPAQHKGTAQKMLENGGWLTEYRSETLPDKNNFPKRNRIVAGMCEATLVVESAEEGGAMITAALAAGYGRDVLAVPGAISAHFSKGCNKLIKQQVAQLVESADDIITSMGWDIDSQPKNIRQSRMMFDLEEDEMTIYNLLQKNEGEMGIDAISEQCGLLPGKIASSLLSLECKGAIRTCPGKRYSAL